MNHSEKGKVHGAAADVLSLRTALHLSSHDVADILGISVKALEAWEQGERPDQEGLAVLRKGARHLRALHAKSGPMRPDLPRQFSTPKPGGASLKRPKTDKPRRSDGAPPARASRTGPRRSDAAAGGGPSRRESGPRRPAAGPPAGGPRRADRPGTGPSRPKRAGAKPPGATQRAEPRRPDQGGPEDRPKRRTSGERSESGPQRGARGGSHFKAGPRPGSGTKPPRNNTRRPGQGK